MTNHLKLKELFGCIKIGAIKFLQKNLKIKLHSCGAVAKAVIEDLITAVEQKEKETVDKIKREEH